MKFVPEPSLEHFALVKIVIALWNRSDVRCSIAKFSFRLPVWNRLEEWQNIEVRVMEKVPRLPLPKFLNERIKSFVRPIGIQILKWIEYHREDHYIQINLPAEICWTPQGTIDKRKTAEILVKEEKLDITIRYNLACIYCLENNISELWSKVPKSFRESFSYTGRNHGKLFIFWEKEMLEKKFGLHYHPKSSIQSVFEFSAMCGNKAATEYFLPKLTARERNQSLLKTAQNVQGAEVLCFLLSQMDEEQKTQIFIIRPCKVLHCFLNWPLQSLFIEMADLMWDFLSACDYSTLLVDVIEKIKLGYTDWNYQNLFGMFWLKSPSNFKTYVIDTCGSVLTELFHIKYKESLKFIIRNVSLTEKKKIIYADVVQKVCEKLFLEENWDLLGFLIHECLPSEYEMMEFRKKFEIRRNIKYNLTKNKQKWNQLFSLNNQSLSLYIKN